MDKIREKYTDPSFPGSFTEIGSFYNQLDSKIKNRYTKSQVKKALLKDEYIAVMVDLPRKHETIRVIVPRINYLFESDVALFRKDISKYNNGYIGFLLVIDAFSKYVWCRAIKEVNSRVICKAFENILKTLKEFPDNVRTDKGHEYGLEFKKLMTKYGINHFYAVGSNKSCIAERSIQSLKVRLYKYMIHKNTNKWYTILPEIVKSYNLTYHNSIKMSPAEVNDENSDAVWRSMYEMDFAKYPKERYIKKPEEKVKMKKQDKKYNDSPNFKFKIGDIIRLSTMRYVFMRKFSQRYSNEMFTITDRFVDQGQNMYKIKDGNNTMVLGKIYEYEMMKVYVPRDSVFRISHIRKKVGKKYLVSWVGHNRRFDSYVNESDITFI